MPAWSLDRARHTYSIPYWSEGYFDVDAGGRMRVLPRGAGGPSLDLPGIVDQATAAGLKLPLLLRFSDILGNRLGKLKEDLKLLQALCLAYWRGEYRAISPKALISVVAGLMYFLSPIDAIPDFIPMFGMLDDIAVLAWVMKTLEGELSAFRAWRDAQRPEKLAVVERLPATPALLAKEHPQKN